MSISSIGGTTYSAPAQAVRSNPEAAEIRKSGPDNDGDSDDVKAAAPKAGPSVNMNGQKTGQVISVTA